LWTALALAPIAVLPPGASTVRAENADSIETVIRELGLLGRWATDCDQPASRALPQQIFVVKGGTVWRLLDIGDGSHEFDYTIAAAQRVGPNRLALRTEGTSVTFDIILELRDGWIQTQQSTDGKGKTLIDKSIIVASGQPSARQRRCGV
jgi:hypothetical protein